MNRSELKSNEERFLLILTYVDHASNSEVILGKSSKITTPGRTPGISYQLLLSPAGSVRQTTIYDFSIKNLVIYLC